MSYDLNLVSEIIEFNCFLDDIAVFRYDDLHEMMFSYFLYRQTNASLRVRLSTLFEVDTRPSQSLREVGELWGQFVGRFRVAAVLVLMLLILRSGLRAPNNCTN